MKLLRLSVWLALAAPVPVLAQNAPVAQQPASQKLSLQQCIDLAIKNNLQIRQSENAREQSRLLYNQSRGNLLPNINGNASHNYNFGRSIDPVTNSFIDQRIQSNNFSINGNVVLFSGFQRQNAIKQNALEYEAGKLDVETARNDIMLEVVTAYLQILFADELIQTSQLQLQNTNEQLTRAQKLFNAGSIAESNVIELKAQAASDELNIITAENQKELAELNLVQLLNLKEANNIEIIRPNLPDPTQLPLPASAELVYQTALQNQPQVKSADLRIRSAIKGVEVAKGGYYPTLALTGNVYTLYSSANDTRFSFTPGAFVEQPIGYIPGANPGDPGQVVYTQSPVMSTSPYGFNDQIRDNISRSVGLSLSIPIINGFQNRNTISRARLANKNAELQAEITRQQLHQNIERAFTDARAAEKKFAAASRQLVSFEQAFNNAQKRFDQGVMNTTDFNVSKNNFTRAQSDLIQAKFDYIFKLKVLDFYQGKPITL